jgi:hypothetical protein
MKKLDYLEKKEILFSPKTPREELIHWGDHFLENNRLHDAVAFYRQARHEEGLERIRQIAVKEGDYQLYCEVLEGMEGVEEDAIREELSSLAKRAEELGKWHFAQKAYSRIRDNVGVKRAQKAIMSIMGIEGSEGQS